MAMHEQLYLTEFLTKGLLFLLLPMGNFFISKNLDIGHNCRNQHLSTTYIPYYLNSLRAQQKNWTEVEALNIF